MKAKIDNAPKAKSAREREADFRAEDEFMLRDGHRSLFYDYWVRSRGDDLLEVMAAIAEARARDGLIVTDAKLASAKATSPPSRGVGSKSAPIIEGTGAPGFDNLRRKIATLLAAKRAARAKAERGRGG